MKSLRSGRFFFDEKIFLRILRTLRFLRLTRSTWLHRDLRPEKSLLRSYESTRSEFNNLMTNITFFDVKKKSVES